MQLISPVDMGVDLEHPNRPVTRETGKKRNGHGVVASEQDRYGRQRQDLPRLRLDAGSVAGVIRQSGRDVAGVDAGDRLAIEQRAVEIEIPILNERCILPARRTDGVGGQGVTTAVVAGVGAAVSRSEDHCARPKAICKAIREAKKGR